MTLSPSLTKRIFLLLLLLFGLLALIFSVNIPLGESPDEYAHFKYVQFLAEHGRPPINMAERETVGYRSKWPPLYQYLAAPLARWGWSDGPDSLKDVSSNSRNAIALDGLNAMVFLHTDDESFPFRGIARSWRAARLASIALSLGTLIFLFLTLRYEFSALISLLITAAAALLPEFLFISAVINDDALLGFLTALFLWILWPLFRREGTWQRYLALGIVAGLAMTTKYSVLFLPFSLLWLHLLLKRPFRLLQGGLFAGGYLLMVSGWVFFVLYHFEQIKTFGLPKGLIAPFLLGGVDPTTRALAAAIKIGGYNAPTFNFFYAPWREWLQTFFVTALFPRADMSVWLWIPLLVFFIAALIGSLLSLRRSQKTAANTPSAHSPTRKSVNPQIRKSANPQILFSLGYILLFVPLPLYRFVITSNIAETAQGRHILFPALIPLAMLLGFGLRYWLKERGAAAALIALILFFSVSMAFAVWPKITLADFPPLPVKTSLDSPPQLLLNNDFGNGIRLLGLDFPDGADPNALPLTLVWQAQDVLDADYTVQLQLSDENDRLLGVWQGQPVNGRYPTRAWDKGDVIYDTVWLPVLGSAAIKSLNLSVALRAAGEDGGAARVISLPASVASKFNALPPQVTAGFQTRLLPRGDGFDVRDPYRYRSAMALTLNIPASGDAVVLQAPDGQRYAPTLALTGFTNAIAIFNVDWPWPAGDYDLLLLNEEGSVQKTIAKIARVQNRRRLLAAPPLSHPLNANFNDQFELLGYELPVNRVLPGEEFEVTLVWKALAVNNTSYKIFNHLLNAEGMQYGGQDRIPQGYYSAILWNPGEVVIDRYAVSVAANAPNGIYWLDVGLYPEDDPLAPLPLADTGQTGVKLGPVKVGGQPAASLSPAPPDVPRQEQFGDFIALKGYSLAREADKQLRLNLYWEATASPPLDYTLFIHLVDASGAVAAQFDSPPVNGLYPTSFWDAGEQIFDSRRLDLSELSPGEYTMRLGWYDSASGQRLPVSGNPENFVEINLEN